MRRNPVVAGLSAAVVLLLGGAAVATTFAVRASQRAGELAEKVVAQALPRLTDAEVAQVGELLLAALDRSREGRTRLGQRSFGSLVRALLPRLAPATYDALAAKLVDRVVVARDGSALVVSLLRSLLAGVPRPGAARAVAGLVGGRLAGTPWLGLAHVAPPGRLSDGDLLALLVEPLCVGEPRRAVLEVLERRHGRPFLDHWDAARFLRRANQGRP